MIISRYRFPAEIIQRDLWLYFRFSVIHRNIEDHLAQRGIFVSYETIRRSCRKFGPVYAKQIRRDRGRQSDVWFVDEVFIRINRKLHYRYRTVDQDGDVLDIRVDKRRNYAAAKRVFSKLLKGQGASPKRLFTDKLASYPRACREVMPDTVRDTSRYANNRAEIFISRPGSVNDRCANSSPVAMHNRSYPSMGSFKIYSDLEDV